MMDTMDNLRLGIGQYDDFHTIDWLRDIGQDRTRHRNLIKKQRHGCWQRLLSAHDAWSGWLCVLLVGCAAGMPPTTASFDFNLGNIMYCFMHQRVILL